MPAALSLSGAVRGDGAAADRPRQAITVWIVEDQADQVRAAQQNVAAFTRRTGIDVRLVPVGDEEFPRLIERARADGRLNVAQLPVASVHPCRAPLSRWAPLSRFYTRASILSLGEGVRSFERWGLAHGEGALMGALRGWPPISRALASAIGGRRAPGAAARAAQAAVERARATTR
jgi:hypothetical protein